MKSSSYIDLQRFMLIPTKFPLTLNQASEIPTTKKIRNIMTVLTIPPYIPDNKMKRYFLVSLIVPDVIYIFYLRL